MDPMDWPDIDSPSSPSLDESSQDAMLPFRTAYPSSPCPLPKKIKRSDSLSSEPLLYQLKPLPKRVILKFTNASLQHISSLWDLEGGKEKFKEPQFRRDVALVCGVNWESVNVWWKAALKGMVRRTVGGVDLKKKRDRKKELRKKKDKLKAKAPSPVPRRVAEKIPDFTDVDGSFIRISETTETFYLEDYLEGSLSWIDNYAGPQEYRERSPFLNFRDELGPFTPTIFKQAHHTLPTPTAPIPELAPIQRTIALPTTPHKSPTSSIPSSPQPKAHALRSSTTPKKKQRVVDFGHPLIPWTFRIVPRKVHPAAENLVEENEVSEICKNEFVAKREKQDVVPETTSEWDLLKMEPPLSTSTPKSRTNLSRTISHDREKSAHPDGLFGEEFKEEHMRYQRRCAPYIASSPADQRPQPTILPFSREPFLV